MGNYTAEGNWELKNVTNKPLGTEWNSTASTAANASNSSNASNATNATDGANATAAEALTTRSTRLVQNETAAASGADASSDIDQCSKHQVKFGNCKYPNANTTNVKPVYDKVFPNSNATAPAANGTLA